MYFSLGLLFSGQYISNASISSADYYVGLFL